MANLSIPQTIRMFNNIKSYSSLSNVFKKCAKTEVDSVILLLHSVVSVSIILGGAFFLTMNNYFGEPIECVIGKTDIPTVLVQRYCWIEGTFSATSNKESGNYYGVKHINETTVLYTTNTINGCILYYYYKYAYIICFANINCVMFYLPKYIWNISEKGNLKNIVSVLKTYHIASLKKFDKYKILHEIADAMYLGKNYFASYLSCEIMCLVNLLLQIWLTNVFLGSQFYLLGYDWFRNAHNNTISDPLIKIFPRIAKCTFHKYGYSGTLETLDSMCFLLLNNINEKIYLTLWFWYIILFIITVMVLLYRGLYASVSISRSPTSKKATVKKLCKRIGH
ncbi:Innexin inx2-like protein, partial [Leptotrombidium deliense]